MPPPTPSPPPPPNPPPVRFALRPGSDAVFGHTRVAPTTSRVVRRRRRHRCLLPPVATPCLCLSLLLQVCNEIWVVDKGTVSKWHSDIVSYKEHLRKSHAALNKRSDLG